MLTLLLNVSILFLFLSTITDLFLFVFTQRILHYLFLLKALIDLTNGRKEPIGSG